MRDEPPLRSELFSREQISQYGRVLAALHRIGPDASHDQLLPRLDENEEVLLESCRLLSASAHQNQRVSPAGEWLLDNFHLIEEEVRVARRLLPRGYSRELPRLLSGPSVGLPRVYDMALEIIAHGDGKIDPAGLHGFITSYQTVSPLKLGELWAIPIMLRLALIENLRRTAARLSAGRRDRNRASAWATEMKAMTAHDPKSLILVVADMARSDPPMSGAFVAELVRDLEGHIPALALPLSWVAQHLTESGQTIEQLVQAENQQQAANQVSVANSIDSLRFLEAMDWREFVEQMSVVETALRTDPAGIYLSMDFATRDRYRHAVEKIATRARRPEAEVANLALNLARSADQAGDERATHVGHYLLQDGLPALERAAGLRPTGKHAPSPLLLYVGPVLLLTALVAAGGIRIAHLRGFHEWTLWLVGALALVAASHFAVTIVNWVATTLAHPRALPRMDYLKGIPPTARTLVAVPTMLTGSEDVSALIEALEVRFLANRDPRLHFGLLTDWRDAPSEHLSGDDDLLAHAANRIAELNEEYPGPDGDAFFLFHRPRRWNARERTWMGYERKRGKLADLNALLRGHGADRFARIVGDIAILQDVRYVITLDSDTELPRDAARELVGVMAHPLNRPHYDAVKCRVTSGYGILQPRVGVNLPGTNRSRYAALFSGNPGLDPYTRTVSDVYQDLFHEGSFIGKGIYDVDVFELALKGRLPENRILSHDLLEGCYARAGLVTDVVLYETFPASYDADLRRRHRWIRGDWQIAAWVLPRVRELSNACRNPLPALARWKIFDNLRRSLVTPALMLLLLLGWAFLAAPLRWTGAVLSLLLAPPLIASLPDFWSIPEDVSLRRHLTASLRLALRELAQAVFTLACLPSEAVMNLDAIVRTAGRMLRRRRLLEWSTASEVEGQSGNSRSAYWRAMWSGPAIVAATLATLLLTNPGALRFAGPVLALWLVSPLIAWWTGRPRTRRQTELNDGEIRFLRKAARKTWAFFETFVGATDNWLPPDNYQEHDAGPVIAHRTSPTNIGLSLLANLAACDFGYIRSRELIARTAGALDTMERMERFRGHLYNWYDTLTLAPLPPRYVSTVDSGNLAGHLVTLRAGLRALGGQPVVPPTVMLALQVTLDIVREESAGRFPKAFQDLEQALEAGGPPTTLAAASRTFEDLALLAGALSTALDADPVAEPEAKWWGAALARQCRQAADDMTELATAVPGFADAMPSLMDLARREAGGTSGSGPATLRLAELERLAERAGAFADIEMDFLYDRGRRQLAIGYNVTENRRDSGCYDLLASEARLSVFLGIAQGKLPQESWFALSRQLTTTGGDPVLLSWSGSMFEYLMPELVMPEYDNTLLEQTARAAVARQIEYGGARGVPWGISESGYNAMDGHFNYQYRAFGVPGLGLKRGLGDDLVVAPYATMLALMVAPHEACHNLQRLAGAGAEGRYGFLEAIDYVASRLPRGQSSALVRSFMSHHEGMSLLAMASCLLNQPMQQRFASDPEVRATLLLLHERIPGAVAIHRRPAEIADGAVQPDESGPAVRIIGSADTPTPELQLLSNGRYHVMITNAGGGYSRWKDLAVTRWREDGTRDHWGTFCYLRDVTSRAAWSAAHQPTLQRPDRYEAILSEAKAEFRRVDHDIESHMEVAVSPEDDIELRRITLTNRSDVRRTIEITSYAEVVLAPAAADTAHPGFSNLFVQTEILAPRQAIVCSRRPRSAQETVPWMCHLMRVHGTAIEEMSYETDRLRFIGRGESTVMPRAMRETGKLAGGEGSVLDPIVAIRARIRLEPGQHVTVDMVNGMSETREGCLGLIDKYQDRQHADRVFGLAWTHGHVVLRQLNTTEAEAQLFGRLAGYILYGHRALRADAGVLVKNRRGQSGLWGFSISGDLPILLAQLNDPGSIEMVRQLVRAHAYWRRKGLAVDLVIWNDDHSGYRQLLHEQILGLIGPGVQPNVTDRGGGIFVRPAEQISNEDRILLQSVARVIVNDTQGTLASQLDQRRASDPTLPPMMPAREPRPDIAPVVEAAPKLQFFNGLGGFSPDGREYVIITGPGRLTPLPWVNVLANPQFGSVVTDGGGGYTWSENAHELRLTPWHGDQVGDNGSEAFYLRDEESGAFWSPTPQPSRGTTSYTVRHGFGYSRFEHSEDGIASELCMHVAPDAPVKFIVLKVRNASDHTRRLSATGYVEWVLGDLRASTAMHVVTEPDMGTGAIFARNRYNSSSAARTAFFHAENPDRSVTGDRIEFLGRNGTPANPAAMSRGRLSGRLGAALDPCAAIRVPFELAAGQEREIVFLLGLGRDAQDASDLVRRYRGTGAARAALDATTEQWNQILSAVRVETADPAFDVLANGWLVYQTLSCRLWARSGYYQSGGAFGFRDQLQDVMALVHTTPHLVRAQLLLAASRQFVAGDVQHWWHANTGQGVRTHISDDYLWLPLATCRYVQATGDLAVLDESVSFIEGRQVDPEQDSYYDRPMPSEERGTLYEHCSRAILHGLTFGEHGLPLMGSGDWNDGMNLVGVHGRGESVWLGFFLHDVLTQFAPVAARRGDAELVRRCQSECERLRANLEQHGWDGAWYQRAYFDDGTPLGSATNEECQIDAIAQSWSVLSGAGRPDRAAMAMESADRRLVRRDASLIELLAPPFDKSAVDPGYIKGYVPGVRENGGQYTHAAIWMAMAFAALGDGKRAWELFGMINPVRHGMSPQAVATYKAEPYVVAADVYAVAPHTGRGGWSWYTGSAGWLYRLMVESLLGLRLEGEQLRITPCLPPDWKPYMLHYRRGTSMYHIAVEPATTGEGAGLTVDGVVRPDGTIPLADDGAEHTVVVRIAVGATADPPHESAALATGVNGD